MRPKLLFLCQTLPFPPDGGVQIRTYNVMRLLAREFDITALCFYRRADRKNAQEVRASIEGLALLAKVEVFPIDQEHHRLRLAADHGLSVITGRAYTVRAYKSSAFGRRLKQLLETERFDLVHMDSLDLSGYLPMLRGLPVVCVHHNVESALLARRAATSRQPMRAYIALQSRLVEKEERRWCPTVVLNITVSQDDRTALQKIAPAARVAVVPNGVDSISFQPKDQDQSGLVFVGAYSWQPNRDAMEYFCSEILPILRGRGQNVETVWVGRATDAIKQEYERKHGVRLTGYVDDIRPIVHGAACYIAPLRAGGGTRLKILDAFAMGKAVVSTSVGCEGIDTRDGDNILIRDDPEGFATAIEAVLSDGRLRQSLGRNARRTVEERYDWDVVGRPMLAEYRALLNRKS